MATPLREFETDKDGTPPQKDPGVQVNEDGSTTILLEYSVTRGDDEVRELTFKRLKGTDMEASDSVRGDHKKMFAILASMSGESIAVIRRLDAVDIERIGEIIDTGKKSQETGDQ